LVVLAVALIAAPHPHATEADPAAHSIQQFLAQGGTPHSYRALRRLEAETGSRSAWLEAVTEYFAVTGFQYSVTAEGGSRHIRTKILKAVLDGERDVIARGEAARASLAPTNYTFDPNGIDAEGLANVLLTPRRKEGVLLSGTMFLRPIDGELVRLQGRLAKSPSFWVKNVDVVRTYQRIDGVVLPVALETTAQVRFFGNAKLRMTYAYWEIDGRPLASSQ
jgi:hypothetical protein